MKLLQNIKKYSKYVLLEFRSVKQRVSRLFSLRRKKEFPVVDTLLFFCAFFFLGAFVFHIFVLFLWDTPERANYGDKKAFREETLHGSASENENAPKYIYSAPEGVLGGKGNQKKGE
ncbi:hypothetical protein HZA38_02805 [Candidatus Peregrinibacteria bacterium]|nr:hypothetical protein [Candidatus Peregrinibacteria bacterium]